MGNKKRERDDKDSKPLRKRKKKVCVFCAEKTIPDFKNIDLMRRFVSERGKIMSKRGSGCCSKHQRAIAIGIKRARHVGLLPYTVE